MSKQQALEYLIWFQAQIPVRIHILTEYVQSFPKYHTWEADLKPSSLNELGKCFYEHVTTRERTQEELKSIFSKAPDLFRYIIVPEDELTVQTLSLCIDIGMYPSYMMLHNIPGLHWELGGKPKNNIDYQQPVLAGSAKLVFNPVHIITMLAYGFADHKQRPERLGEVYDIWSKTLNYED